MIVTSRYRPRIAAPLALAALAVVLGAAAPAPAQRLTFDQKKYDAAPGETLELKIYVSDAPSSVSGANFTVRISAEDAKDVRLKDATSAPNPQLTALGFTHADNYLVRSHVTTGEIVGDVEELRGAVYSTRTPPFTFPANSPRQIASVLVPIDINAQGRVLVELVPAVDNGVALLGVADAQGDPMIPAGHTTPEGDVASIVIEQRGTPIVTDLTLAREQAGWIYSSPLPDGPEPKGAGNGVPGVGLTTQSIVDGTYTVWNWDFLRRGAWRSPEAGRLLVTDWKVKADVGGVETPPIRLRTMTANSVISVETLIQDLWWNNDDISIVPGTGGRTYRTLMQVPLFAADGYGSDGTVPYFDMIVFDGIGKAGSMLTLTGLTETVVDPLTLGGKQLQYFRTFDSRNDGGWKFAAGALGGKEVSYSRSRYGLGIQSGGPLETTEEGQTYSYGLWHAEPGLMKVKADGTKWYNVEAFIHGTAEDPAWNAMSRLRVYPANNEYFSMMLFAPQLDPQDYHIKRTDLDGTTLSAWFTIPPEFDGEELGMAFDLIHLDAPSDGTDRTPALFLKWVRVTTYDAPDLN
ncbi:MAG: hypothetical protein PWP23_3290 [Candidatus Sumerlaeota bacterium]|nr:hypothetical protein [Candidatus Sumerlaeota bacterium]